MGRLVLPGMEEPHASHLPTQTWGGAKPLWPPHRGGFKLPTHQKAVSKEGDGWAWSPLRISRTS